MLRRYMPQLTRKVQLTFNRRLIMLTTYHMTLLFTVVFVSCMPIELQAGTTVFNTAGVTRQDPNPALDSLLKAMMKKVEKGGLFRRPLSTKQLGAIYRPHQNLLSFKDFTNYADNVTAVFREVKDSYKVGSNKTKITSEINRKFKTLQNRSGTFKGHFAEAKDARLSNLEYIKGKDSQVFDLRDPRTRKMYQHKVGKTAQKSISYQRKNFQKLITKHPDKAKFFRAKIPNDQFQELVEKGTLKKGTFFDASIPYYETLDGIKVEPMKGIASEQSARKSVVKAKSTHLKLRRHSSHSHVKPSRSVRKVSTTKQVRLGTGNLVGAAKSGAIAGLILTPILEYTSTGQVTVKNTASGGVIGAGSMALIEATAQTLERQFGTQLSKTLISKGYSKAAAETLKSTMFRGVGGFGVGVVLVNGYVGYQWFNGQISNREAQIQTGMNTTALTLGVGTEVIIASTLAGTELGTFLGPGWGNAIGCGVGAVVGMATYAFGNFYYENFKQEKYEKELQEMAEADTKHTTLRAETRRETLIKEAHDQETKFYQAFAQ